MTDMTIGSKRLSIVVGVIFVAALVSYMALRDNSQTDTLSEQNKTSNSNVVDNTITTASPLSNTNTEAQPATTALTTTDETANWKTYTNSKYGFSLKYPSNWIMFENANANPQNDRGLFHVSDSYYGSISVALQDMQMTTTNDTGRTYKFSQQSLGGNSLSSAIGYGGSIMQEKIFEAQLGSQTAIVMASIAGNHPTYTDSQKWEKLDQILATFQFSEESVQ